MNIAAKIRILDQVTYATSMALFIAIVYFKIDLSIGIFVAIFSANQLIYAVISKCPNCNYRPYHRLHKFLNDMEKDRCKKCGTSLCENDHISPHDRFMK